MLEGTAHLYVVLKISSLKVCLGKLRVPKRSACNTHKTSHQDGLRMPEVSAHDTHLVEELPCTHMPKFSRRHA